MNKVRAAKTIIKLAQYLATESGSMRTAGAKYELTDITTRDGNNNILYRVKYSDGKLGGYIQSEKNLQGNAKVLTGALVTGNAVVKDNAVVKGGSVISDHAIISGNAIVDNCTVKYKASISGSAKVTDSDVWECAVIKDNAIVDKSVIDDKATILGHAKVLNCSSIEGTTQVSGYVSGSTIYGKSKILGQVIHSTLCNQVVERQDCLKDEKLLG